MQYGYFDNSAREYIITDPKTPVKWINYIGTLAFGGFIDHTGGALLCKNDPALNRITKYISQMPAGEFKGTSLYIRVKAPHGYQIFSPYFVPCLVPYQSYECHVGLGYTRIVSRVGAIESDVTIFVPLPTSSWSASCEVRRIRIKNISNGPILADIIPVVEYTHFDALKQLTNADWVPQTMQSELVEQVDGQKLLLQYAFMRKQFAINYFTSNAPVDSFETDRKAFLGANEYGTWAKPFGLLNEKLSNSIAARGDNIAALLHRPGLLHPGQTHEIITLLGQAQSQAEAQATIDRYRRPEAVEEALQEQAAFWDQYLRRQQVNTPDPALNAMLNVHNPHQCYVTLNWSRYLSYYQLGYGARGIGFRDSSQDAMGVLALAPEEALALMRKLLGVQRRNGSAYHQFNPLSMVASEGDALEREDRLHYYSDDHLWIVLAVTAYLKETGNIDFLDEVLPFYDKNKNEKPLESGTVFEHLRRAVEFTRGDIGAHGLPRLGFADWNDTINLPTGAESLLTANLYGAALWELTELSNTLSKNDLVAHFQRYFDEMKERVNQEAWDGEWYLSYFDADGQPLGSHRNDAGQIYAYAQAWPVISGFAEPARAQIALNAVERLLNTRNGIKLSTPGFNGYDPAKGGITTYPPGAKENCGIFLHVNPWVIIAETLTGNGERAFRYYSQINPAKKNECIEEFECEPYVYPQNILSDEHPFFGLARNSWLSGTASWMYQAGTRYILGIRPEYSGLRVDPCIPAEWNGFEVSRVFRGATYHIIVHNPDHVCKGVKQLSVDGKVINGSLVPVLTGEHTVDVLMG
jgi:cellobiose phosphorylase